MKRSNKMRSVGSGFDGFLAATGCLSSRWVDMRMTAKRGMGSAAGWMLAIAGLVTTVSCGQQSATQAKPPVGELVVTYEYPNYSLPFVVALHKGLFAEEGVKITARKIGTGDRLDISQIDVINGHDFDLLKEGRGAILAVHPFSRKSDFEKAMLVKKSAGISDWKDFKGKGVVVADAGSDMPMLNRVFGEHGLKTMGTEGRDVTLWGGGGAVSGFAANKDVHALYGWSSTVLPLMRQRPDDFVILWKDLEKKESPESPLVACSYVKASLLPEKREAVKAYARAIDRAIDLIRHDPSGAVGILPKYFDVDKKWASTMEVYDFHKSGEAVDLKGLSGKLGFDVEGSLLSLSEK